jgi:hypothetical protein
VLFISYSSIDWEDAEAICAALERSIPCWMAPRDISVGDDWGSAILSGLESSDGVVLVFSAQANRSLQVRREVAHAARRNLPIYPIRLDDTPSDPAFGLFAEEFAAAAEPTRPLTERVARLTAAVSHPGVGSSLAGFLERRTRESGNSAATSSSLYLLRTSLTAAIVVTVVRALLIGVAFGDYWTKSLSLREMQEYLVVALPFHVATVISLLCAFIIWLSSACSSVLGWSAETVLRAFLRPPRNLVAPARALQALIDAVPVTVPRWKTRAWWPLIVCVLVLTAIVTVSTLVDGLSVSFVLGADAALTTLWAIAALVTVSIVTTITAAPARTEARSSGAIGSGM